MNIIEKLPQRRYGGYFPSTNAFAPSNWDISDKVNEIIEIINTAETMTLDEAIKHAEEVGNACDKCAKEHRQLAEWLKDYKRLLLEVQK